MRAHAFQIADARRHVLNPPPQQDEEFTLHHPDDHHLDDGALAAEAARELDLLPEQLSLFSVLSAVATGMTVHAFTEQGLTHFDDEPDAPEPDSSNDPDLQIDLPDIPTDAGLLLPETRCVAEIKEALRERNFELTRDLVDKTGWGHARVNAELNRLAGITTVGGATNDQLQRRLRHADAWLRRR